MHMSEPFQDWNPPVHMTTTTGGTLPTTVGNVLNLCPDMLTNAVYPYYTYVVQPPTVCCGDVHVFPCPHCDKCKCGAATVKRAKKRDS